MRTIFRPWVSAQIYTNTIASLTVALTGVNFMEKTISIRNTEITFSIWDLGGQREFVNMLPLVCNDAVAILFMFDLTRKSTLNSIKEWYRQGRGFNKTAIPFLVGTKYDHFVNFPKEEQEEISMQAKRFAKAMKASLIFSSTSHSINVQKVRRALLSTSASYTRLTHLCRRSSRLSFQRPSISVAPFPKSNMSVNHSSCTNPSRRLIKRISTHRIHLKACTRPVRFTNHSGKAEKHDRR